MEEESGRSLNLIAYLREHRAQLDHWYYDEVSFSHRDISPGDALLSAFREVETSRDCESWEKRRPKRLPSKVLFVDGRMRVYGRILLGGEVLLLGEIAAGHAIWGRKSGLSMGFSPHNPPEKQRVLGVSEQLVLTWQQNENHPRIELGNGIDFILEGSGRLPRSTNSFDASQQALFNAMQKLEKKVVGRLLSQGVPVIQDGTVHANDPIFSPGVGPLGLVKRIENFRLPIEGALPSDDTVQLSQTIRQMLFELDKGERTPFLGAFFEDGSSLQRVFTYTRLVDRNDRYPLKGLVRCEVVVRQENAARFKDDLTLFFDQMVSLLPELTGDYPWRRLPENIFPIIALEDHLGQFFLSPDLVRYYFERSMIGKQ